MGGVGSVLITVGVTLSSFCTSLVGFSICYGVLFGMGMGLSYIVPFMVSWGYYPQYRSRVTGLLMAIFGYGGTVFTMLSTFVVNPDNESSTLQETHGITTHYYFREEIARRTPAMLLTLAGCYGACSLLGVLLISEKKAIVKVQLPESTSVTMKDLTSWTFLCLYFASFLSFGLSMYVSCAYKMYGNVLFNDDYYLAVVGSITALINGTSRFFWAEAMEKFSFKTTYIVLLIVQILTSATLPTVATTKLLYFIYMTLAFINQGGHFVLFPAICAKMYGRTKGTILFSILYSEFGMSAFTAFLLQKYAVVDIGYAMMFYILTAAAVVSLGMALTFQEVNEAPPNPLTVPLLPENPEKAS